MKERNGTVEGIEMQPGDTLMPRLQWHYNTVHSPLSGAYGLSGGPATLPCADKREGPRGRIRRPAIRDWPEHGTSKTALKKLCIKIRDIVRDRAWDSILSLLHTA